jgi:hypothetical protein
VGAQVLELEPQALAVREVVGIVAGQERRAGVRERDAEGCRQAAARRVKHAQARIAGRRALECLSRAVARAAVHGDDLEVGEGLALERGERGAQPGCGVVDGQQHRDRGHAWRVAETAWAATGRLLC